MAINFSNTASNAAFSTLTFFLGAYFFIVFLVFSIIKHCSPHLLHRKLLLPRCHECQFRYHAGGGRLTGRYQARSYKPEFRQERCSTHLASATFAVRYTTKYILWHKRFLRPGREIFHLRALSFWAFSQPPCSSITDSDPPCSLNCHCRLLFARKQGARAVGRPSLPATFSSSVSLLWCNVGLPSRAEPWVFLNLSQETKSHG